MDFMGFANNDFEFFKKKSTMAKNEYDEKKEEVKRHFRELSYQIQKYYHSTTGGILPLDKDFQGLNKNRDNISAKSKINDIDFLGLSIDMCQDNITINLVSPPDDDTIRLEMFINTIADKKDTLIRFFKENKSAFLVLYRVDFKKSGDSIWTEEFKFQNNELCTEGFQVLVDNISRLRAASNTKRSVGVRIKIQFSKADVIRMGKNLPARMCTEVVKFFNLYDSLK